MSSYNDTGAKQIVLFSGTSPAAAGTVLPPTAPGQGLLVGLSQAGVVIIDATIQGGTGGTLDVYIQSSVDADQAGNGTWYPVVHYTQLLSAGAQVRWITRISRGYTALSATPTAVDVNGNAPAAVLPANTVIPDALGMALRVVFVAGVGTSLGATQTIKILASK